MVADAIIVHFSAEDLQTLLNITTADGKGVIDMALTSNVNLAVKLKKKYGGQEQTEPPPQNQADRDRERWDKSRAQPWWESYNSRSWEWGDSTYGGSSASGHSGNRPTWHPGGSDHKRSRSVAGARASEEQAATGGWGSQVPLQVEALQAATDDVGRDDRDLESYRRQRESRRAREARSSTSSSRE